MRRGAVAVIVEHGKLLLIRRSQSVEAPGAYCFPGGGIEAGETEEDALCRELREELAAEVTPIRRIWSSVTPWRVSLAWWLARLAPGAVPTAQPAEVESIHWCAPDELSAWPGLLESNRAFLRALANGELSLD